MGEGGEGVVWYSGDDPGCIASRMPRLGYSVGPMEESLHVYGYIYSVADQRYPHRGRAHQAISATVKLEDTLKRVLAYFATWAERAPRRYNSVNPSGSGRSPLPLSLTLSPLIPAL